MQNHKETAAAFCERLAEVFSVSYKFLDTLGTSRHGWRDESDSQAGCRVSDGPGRYRELPELIRDT